MSVFNPSAICEVLSEKSGLGVACQVDPRDSSRIEYFFTDLPRANTFFFDLAMGWHIFKVTARPGAFSRDLLRAMRMKGAEDSSTFLRIYKAIGTSKVRSSLKINGTVVDVGDPRVWTIEWASFEWTIEPEPSQFSGREEVERIQIITDTLLRCIGAIVSIVPIHGAAKLEGGQVTRTVESYERDQSLRDDCLKFYGFTCQVCEFDFEKEYGLEGMGFIEVHHIERLADRQLSETNPITDLIPLCANCHRMAHRRVPPYTPAEIKEMIRRAKARG